MRQDQVWDSCHHWAFDGVRTHNVLCYDGKNGTFLSKKILVASKVASEVVELARAQQSVQLAPYITESRGFASRLAKTD